MAKQANRARPAGGGVFWMAALLAGAVIGMALGEVSLGLLVGLVAGAAIAFWINVQDARKRRIDP